MARRHDIDRVLQEWPYQPGEISARLVRAADGREVVQMRVEMGLLQLETDGRPDGTRPSGSKTYFDYLQRISAKSREPFELTSEQCAEADREFMQFYHRRVCWLALREFRRAANDADHTLAFMDFVRDHSPNDEYRLAHEQYRGFVLFHRTQAAAALAVEGDDPEAAIDAILDGLKRMRVFFAEHDLAEQMEDDGMVQQLHKLEKSLRDLHGIQETLQEQLERAVANEEYEVAARLRDALRKRR